MKGRSLVSVGFDSRLRSRLNADQATIVDHNLSGVRARAGNIEA
jgi:hypothetical protein